MEKTSVNEDERLEDYSYTTLTLGIWRLLLPKESPSSKFSVASGFTLSWDKWNEQISFLPIVWRFMTEIYLLSPGLVLLDLMLGFASTMEGTLMLYASTRLLRTVEVGLVEGRPDVKAILQAVVIRVTCVMLTSTISWAKEHVRPLLQTRVRLHFQEHILRARLRLDLPTGADKNTTPNVNAGQIWSSFQFLSGFLQRTFQLVTQILFILQQMKGGIIFTMLSLVSPVLITTSGRHLFQRGFVYYSDNVDYLRLRALGLLASDDYREDVVTANIGGWISAEYRKAVKKLGNVSDAEPYSTYGLRATPFMLMLQRLSGDFPTLFWAANAILTPKHYTVTSFAILQQHAQALNYSFQIIYHDFTRVSESFSHINELYDMANVENKIPDGDEVYPNSALSSEKGMAFELKNVSFAYPGGNSKENAIKNVSLKIPAGNLVVIVGANGSGKSTIIKLLNRLYDVDSGEILVDGLSIKKYRIADLRKVQALLTQDHKLYPLTLAENIGLGNPNHVDDFDMVMEAAESGGAEGVIKRQKEGLDTILTPVNTARGSHLDKHKHKKLKSILEGLEKKSGGGERQRLVASRTFMRFLSGNIRFAVADEPSSALDPKGEHQLFQRLRESGGGKTMIFVTHRFGHLTKHADLIICMKDGEAIETGTHKELMARGGEYSELYNVQAQAFADATL
ncbi:Lipid A export ATP-binding/permease protein MsbA [Mycena venus]|uniref:Lipid A export ATP-binding/permease protein MsbA n=1 Tax=Mycena venus TaxID=2733690 RepID=A0A8H6X7T9_9AGAR|nr:Lipid A export ATP-binding/permease protein MsbA [Mycena venus]